LINKESRKKLAERNIIAAVSYFYLYRPIFLSFPIMDDTKFSIFAYSEETTWFFKILKLCIFLWLSRKQKKIY